ncbi:C-4 sterol methyl oxidase [Irineochytrium annulatum]|nr:C-4 sterol methyl oxidase [Irineochytrium annulatum]
MSAFVTLSPDLFNATVRSINAASSHYISESAAEILIRTVIRCFFANLGFLVLTELQHQFFKLMGRLGVLTRVQGTTDDRDILQALIATSSVTLPISLYQALSHARVAPITVYSWNLPELLAVQMFLFLAVDTWYFWGHRTMHKNKFLWNNVHKHHHEKKLLNVYSTAYAAFVENLILIAPVIILSIEAYRAVMPHYNKVAWELAIISQALIFNYGHCGYRHSPLFHFLSPPTALVHRIFAPFNLSQVNEDHEMHHLYPLCNFSLNFRLWDTIMGSYKPIEHVIAMKERKQNAGMRSKADAKTTDLKSK